MAMGKSKYRQRAEACLEAFNRVLRNSDIPERIIEDPAPEFYVAVETFKSLVYTAMKAQRRAMRK